MSYTPVSDKELWVVRGEDWSIPVFATILIDEENKSTVAIRAAVPLSAEQYEALSQKITFPEFGTPEGALWFAESMDALQTCATKAPGVTAPYYFRWKGEQPNLAKPKDLPLSPPNRMEKPDLAKDMQKFINRLWERTGLADRNTLGFLYDAICQEAHRWLIEENKVLDLGFARLVALPYRANWKQILLAKFPKIHRFFHLPEEKRDAELELTDYVVEIRNSDLWAIDQKAFTFGWCLEVIPGKVWYKHAQAKEQARMRSVNRGQYSRAWARLVTHLQPYINDAMAHFVGQTARPSGAVAQGSYYGAQVIMPHVPKGAVRPVSPDHVETRVAYPDPSDQVYSHLSSDREPVPVQVQADLVPPQLPTIQLPSENLRNTWGLDDGNNAP